MKDVYIALDYSSSYQQSSDFSQGRTGDIKSYLSAKVTKKSNTLNRKSDITFYVPMDSQKKATGLAEAVDFIYSKLNTIRYTHIKFVVFGHGHYDCASFIYSYQPKRVPVNNVANDIYEIIKGVNEKCWRVNYPVYYIKLCICYSGRSTQYVHTNPAANQSVKDPRNSLAGRLAAQLKHRNVTDFVLKAYFTPTEVSEDESHIYAISEHDLQMKRRIRIQYDEKISSARQVAEFIRTADSPTQEKYIQDAICGVKNKCASVVSELYQNNQLEIDTFERLLLNSITPFCQQLVDLTSSKTIPGDWVDYIRIIGWGNYANLYAAPIASNKVNSITWVCKSGKLTGEIKSQGDLIQS
ncbi:hypothetical protein M9194_16845 [Vibrio sp. S4M6]|uniref:hypothetical protein n=1 Tax=Vibrio sinus TaxID=2946865 RepID=UPI00202A8B9E|nr:hypothetical protein [Vibrio sinus]MCL9783098.1 hypothetical protein [Vibrio sinus]